MLFSPLDLPNLGITALVNLTFYARYGMIVGYKSYPIMVLHSIFRPLLGKQGESLGLEAHGPRAERRGA